MTDQLSIQEYKALAKKKEPPKALLNFRQFLEENAFGALKREFIFHPVRKWRFDFAYPERKIAFEYDGLAAATMRQAKDGQHIGGHRSFDGVVGDIEKINAAQELGWKVFRVHAKSIKDGTAYSLVRRVMEGNS